MKLSQLRRSPIVFNAHVFFLSFICLKVQRRKLHSKCVCISGLPIKRTKPCNFMKLFKYTSVGVDYICLKIKKKFVIHCSNFAPKNPILSPRMNNQSITYNNLFSATFKNSMISKCSKYYCYALVYSTGLLSQLEKIHVHVWAVKYNKWSFFSVWKFTALSQLKKP